MLKVKPHIVKQQAEGTTTERELMREELSAFARDFLRKAAGKSTFERYQMLRQLVNDVKAGRHSLDELHEILKTGTWLEELEWVKESLGDSGFGKRLARKK